MLWSDYRGMTEATHYPLQVGANPGTFAWLGGRSFVLSAQSGAQAEAKRWIAAMTAPAQQLERYAELGMLPARKSAYEREFVMDLEGGPPSKLIAMFGGTPYKPDPDWGTRFNQWSELLSQFAGKSFGPGDAERLIKTWNGQRQNENGA
jgi:hypothetical protein